MKKVKKVNVLYGSLISKFSAEADYIDSYLVDYISLKKQSIDDIPQFLFLDFPNWIRFLTKLRNSIVKLFGLKGGDFDEIVNNWKQQKIEIGKKCIFFTVEDKNENEILMGENDHHLNFKCSIVLNSNRNFHSIQITTAVFYNNLFGRIYFFIIKPFHKIITITMLKRFLRKISS